MVYRPMLKIHEIYLRMISKCIILSTEGGRGDVPLSAITTIVQSSAFYRSVRSPVTCLARASFKAHSKNQATTPLYEVQGTRYPKIGVIHEVKLDVNRPTLHLLAGQQEVAPLCSDHSGNIWFLMTIFETRSISCLRTFSQM